MNYFVLASGMCWVAAAAELAWKGNWRMVVVAICYAIATFALEGAK